MISFVEVKTDTDVKIVEKIARSIWEEHYTPIIGAEQVDYMLDKFQSFEAIKNQILDGYKYYIFKFKENNAGYFAVKPNTKDKSLFLSKLYVDKSYRRYGIAKKAVIYMENMCKETGLNKIWLTVNKRNNSIAAYNKLGFERTDAIVQDIGKGFVMDDYKMEKYVL